MAYEPGTICYGRTVYPHHGSPESCPKCGSGYPKNTNWDRVLDLLGITCKWCGYDWYEVCADWKPKQPPAPPAPVVPEPPTIEQQAEQELEAYLNREEPTCLSAHSSPVSAR